MSQVQPLAYAGPQVNVTCPLCRKRPVVAKRIYGESVCKKCHVGFTNRRQIAYIVDNVILTLVAVAGGAAVGAALPPLSREGALVLEVVLGALVVGAFALRDGFGGQSPGKRLAGVQVVEVETGKPAGFGRSLKRNLFFFVGVVPVTVVGPLLSMIVVLTMASQMPKGPRLGDKFAGTRVIWKKYQRTRLFGGDGLLCTSCGYDLTGNTSGTCPECGVGVTEEQRVGVGVPAVSAAPTMV